MYDDTSLQILEYHRSMLDDRVRTGSFLKAILKTVKPGDVVLDMGCGTGVLSFLACIAGAIRVYAVEQGPIIELAKAICQHNGFQEQVVFINDWSTNVDLPEPVDVIITETIGNLGFEEGILGWVIDAKERFLAPGGQIIPRSIEMLLVPTEKSEYHDDVNTWNQELYGLDFSPAHPLAANNLYWADWSTQDVFLSKPQSLVDIDLMEVEQADFSREITFVAQRDGLFDGLGGWFSAELTPGLVLSNAPPNKTPSWNQTFFPIELPFRVSAGDRLSVEVKVRDNAENWEWRVTVNGSSNGSSGSQTASWFAGNSLSGRLVSPAHQRSPDYIPVRTEEAQVDLLVLGLMDGATPLGEIARQAAAQYPTYFTSYERALEYASQLSEDYARWATYERT
jgi:protein arginine N-methyltransferase 1